MKIAIIGTRGIPNHYGGFEQFAEYLAQFLVERGHEVYVYCSDLHKYKLPFFNGVNLLHMKDFEHILGTTGQFLYDFNCFIDARNRRYDVILQLGYTSSSIWMSLLPKESLVITNMDGLEWKRSKFNFFVKKFLKIAEKIAVKKSDCLVSDSVGIQKYLNDNYRVQSTYIPYGADLPVVLFDKLVLDDYGISQYEYYLIVARMEPENNIEVILDGFSQSHSSMKFIVVGGVYSNKYGLYLKNKYKLDHRICFIGGLYDINRLNVLRAFSNIYFHGHSVGGTNPSLLEAMASNAFICAHHNQFNASVLGQNALYFSNSHDIKVICESNIDNKLRDEFITLNIARISSLYSWETVNNAYLKLFERALSVDNYKKRDYATYQQ